MNATRVPPPRTLVLVDTDCAFCLWAASLLLSLDTRRRLVTAPIRAQREGVLRGVPEARVLTSWHVLTPSGRVLSAGAALAAVLRVLPGLAVLGHLLSHSPCVAEACYRLVAIRRASLARLLPQRWKDVGRRRVEERMWSGDGPAPVPRPPGDAARRGDLLL